MSGVGNAALLLKSWRKKKVLLLFLILSVCLIESSDFFERKVPVKSTVCVVLVC